MTKESVYDFLKNYKGIEIEDVEYIARPGWEGWISLRIDKNKCDLFCKEMENEKDIESYIWKFVDSNRTIAKLLQSLISLEAKLDAMNNKVDSLIGHEDDEEPIEEKD